MRKKPMLYLSVVLLVALGARAGDKTSVGSGDWADAGIWSPSVPTLNDRALIEFQDTVAVSTTGIQVGDVQLAGADSYVNVEAGGSLEISGQVNHWVKTAPQGLNILGGSLVVGGNYKIYGGDGPGVTNVLSVSGAATVDLAYLEIGWWSPNTGKALAHIVGSEASITLSQNLTLGDHGVLRFTTDADGKVTPIDAGWEVKLEGRGALVVDLSAATTYPSEIILIENNGPAAIYGAFSSVSIIGSTGYAVSYTGGNGDDISLVLTSGIMDWAADYALFGSKAEPGSDPDEDMLDNWYEFAFGGNPTNSEDIGYASTFGVSESGGTDWVEYGYARRTTFNSGLTYSLEQCTNLVFGKWTNSGNYVEAGAGALDPDFEWVTNQLSTAGKAQEFVRMNIEREGAPSYYPSIPLLTCDMARYRTSELNSEYIIGKSPSVTTTEKIIRQGYNAYLEIGFFGFSNPSDYVEFTVSAFGELTNNAAIPQELSSDISGVCFRAGSSGVPVELVVEAIDIYGNIITSNIYSIAQDSMDRYSLQFNAPDFKKVSFWIKGADQNLGGSFDGSIAFDDIYLTDGAVQLFKPSGKDDELLAWLKECGIRYFLWNYRDIGGGKGVVPESGLSPDKIPISGIGYAYANFILAEEEGLITSSDARSKILSMLKWQQDQNWFDGTGGWHGFPHHYLQPDGTYYWADVSTVDWAICAAGIRVVRQCYAGDTEITLIADELLGRAQWDQALAGGNKIAMGFDGATGAMNPWRWGLAFSEETELVYLEAVSRGLSASIFSAITRNKTDGFYPSWYGSGFTYNWLQLWTGLQEPYTTNSRMAYERDAVTSQAEFGRMTMGLTACATLSGVDGNGFISWSQYIGNQGSDAAGATSSEVIQVSPAPYGAVLAVPFIRSTAIQALREYVDIGFYHPLLGLPDNVRLNDLPSGIEHPVANWNHLDINIGSIAMAIEQIENNSISGYYLSDSTIATNLTLLIESFVF